MPMKTPAFNPGNTSAKLFITFEDNDLYTPPPPDPPKGFFFVDATLRVVEFNIN